jgi:hypothetical protein
LALELWNGQEGNKLGVSRTEEFKKVRPSALKNGVAGAYGDCFVVNQVKDQMKGEKFADSYTAAHEITAMYLCPNKHTANGHYFYNWVTEKVITRGSIKRVGRWRAKGLE